jgi:hypothetical protein
MVLKRAGTVAILTLLGSFGLAVAWTSGAASAAARRQVAPGLWGGEHVRMIVNPTGALVEYDCASGRIDKPIVLDARGGFDAPGSYLPEHGGPIRETDAVPDRVRYVGRVSGKTMRLTVRRERSKQVIAVFTLTRGDDVLLTKCR